MKKSILFLLALALVAGGAFAADITGKVEVGTSFSFDGTAAENVPLVPTDDLAFEGNITAAVDSYNSATIELREDIGTTTEIGSTNLVKFGSVFFTSDVAGALGLTDLTGGLTLKYKVGWFQYEAPEIGEVSDRIDFSDLLNDNDTNPGGDARFKASGAQGAHQITVGYGGYVNLDAAMQFGSVADSATDFQLLLALYGNIELGPGTFGYLVGLNENNPNEHLLGGTYSQEPEDVPGTDAILGLGLEYKDIALGGLGTLGFGIEGFYALDAYDGDVNATIAGTQGRDDGYAGSTTADDSFGYGVDIFASLLLDTVELNLDVAGSASAILNNIGLGAGLQMPDGSAGVGLNLTLKNVVSDNQTAAGEDVELEFGFKPELWFKAGAAKFTAAFDAPDVSNFHKSKISTTALLEF